MGKKRNLRLLKLAHGVVKEATLPKEHNVIWWDVENIAFSLKEKEERWLRKHHIAVRGFMGCKYSHRFLREDDTRFVRYSTQVGEQSDHAISLYTGRWVQSILSRGLRTDDIKTCVMTQDRRFGDAWAVVLQHNGIHAERVKDWEGIKHFFHK